MAKRATAKQLAARRRFVSMVKSGAFRRGRAKKRRNPSSDWVKVKGIWDARPGVVHRPRVRISRGKQLETLRPRSPYRDAKGRAILRRVNPRRRKRRNQGENMAMPALVNRRRRRSRGKRRNAMPALVNRKRRRSSRRRNPVYFNPVFYNKKRRRAKKRRNPVFFNKRRRRARRNPGAALTVKRILNRQFIIQSLLAAGGFAVGVKTSSMIAKIPGISMLGRFSGVAQLVIGSIVAMYARQSQVKALAGGFAAAGAYDLLAKNIPQLSLPSIQGVDVMGDEGIDVGEIDVGDWNEGNALTGVDTQGDDEGAELVGASGSSYNTSF